MQQLTLLWISSSSSLLRPRYVDAKSGRMKNSKYPPNIFKCPSCQMRKYKMNNYMTVRLDEDHWTVVSFFIFWLKNKLNEETLTSPPRVMFPPKRSRTVSDTPVESRRKTEFTLTFSLKTNHGYGILASRPLTEFYTRKKKKCMYHNYWKQYWKLNLRQLENGSHKWLVVIARYY